MQMMKAWGFSLRKWTSSCEELLQVVPTTHRETTLPLYTAEGKLIGHWAYIGIHRVMNFHTRYRSRSNLKVGQNVVSYRKYQNYSIHSDGCRPSLLFRKSSFKTYGKRN